ncbi:PilN domain-containing protein [Photobacterium alginatilyticum]|uniref:MSHA biogenesis protein MshI n=1 Tax=Photobacterium alginatilyticum TaxID=1775171 RepID=A0ABW9YJB3_9GAMM|nr:PilN domain-containing protein [Photobacterium alginatilyticum]NBI53636.1 MSHA biogenesis protein MshI [Photobacterium alginatilyticum]
MKSKSLLSRYLKKKSRNKQACLAIFADSITVVYESESEWITETLVVSNAGDWDSVIISLLAKHQLGGSSLRLVLGHGLYQSMLIEKPELPREEYSTALPFLVKDLVNESPLELVADGFQAPLKDRLQVVVTNRNQVEQLIRICNEAGCDVVSISAEEVVWGQLTAPSLSQLVLHRRRHASLQLTAFKQQEMCFQRQLRGFPSPLLDSEMPGEMNHALQLDSLALELQRSLDFLSAQLRDTPITQLLISCDDDDDSALAAELSQRLSVSVAAVTPPHPVLMTNAARVAFAALIEPEGANSINLYSEALKPHTQLMTLQNVVLSWALAVVVMVSMAGWYSWQNYQQQQQLAAERSRLDSKQSELNRAKAALAEHIPSPLKVELAGELEQHLAAKQATLKAIEMHDKSLQVGYAGLLRQLSDAASGNISVNRIRVTGRHLDLEGLARTPESVPTWVKAFKGYPDLSDRRFQLMSLGRNEQNVVTFKLLAERGSAIAKKPVLPASEVAR